MRAKVRRELVRLEGEASIDHVCFGQAATATRAIVINRWPTRGKTVKPRRETSSARAMPFQG